MARLITLAVMVAIGGAASLLFLFRGTPRYWFETVTKEVPRGPLRDAQVQERVPVPFRATKLIVWANYMMALGTLCVWIPSAAIGIAMSPSDGLTLLLTIIWGITSCVAVFSAASLFLERELSVIDGQGIGLLWMSHFGLVLFFNRSSWFWNDSLSWLITIYAMTGIVCAIVWIAQAKRVLNVADEPSNQTGI